MTTELKAKDAIDEPGVKDEPEADPIEEPKDPEPEKSEEEPEPEEKPDDDGADVEAEARVLGWKPKDKWNGQGKWRDAAEFIEFTRDSQYRTKERNEKLAKRVLEQDTVIEAMRKRLEEKEQKDFETDLKGIRTKMREAARTGDMDEFDKWEKAEEALVKTGKPQPIKPAAVEEKPEEPPEISAWKDKRSWFDRDKAMTTEAIAFYQSYQARNPSGTIKEALSYVDQRMAKDYPESYENPRRQTAVRVEGTGSLKPKPKTKGYADLPADAKTVAKQLVADGTFKDTEAYAKSYFSQFEEKRA